MKSGQKRAWTVALTASLLFHAMVALFLFRDWRMPMTDFREETVEVSLERPLPPDVRSPEPEVQPPTPVPRQLPARVVDSPLPPFVSPGVAEGSGAASGPPPTAERDDSLQTRTSGLRLPCVGRNLERMGAAERIECQKELMRTAGVMKPLPPGVDGPKLDPEVAGEFRAALDKRQANRPSVAPRKPTNCQMANLTGCSTEEMGIVGYKRQF